MQFICLSPIYYYFILVFPAKQCLQTQLWTDMQNQWLWQERFYNVLRIASIFFREGLYWTPHQSWSEWWSLVQIYCAKQKGRTCFLEKEAGTAFWLCGRRHDFWLHPNKSPVELLITDHPLDTGVSLVKSSQHEIHLNKKAHRLLVSRI